MRTLVQEALDRLERLAARPPELSASSILGGAAVAVSTLAGFWILRRFRRWRRKRAVIDLIPGPPIKNVFIGTLNQIHEHRGEDFIRLSKEYGPIVRMWVALKPAVFLGDPELVKQVMVINKGNYGVGPRRVLRAVVGDHSMLRLDGEDWTTHRRLISPAFHSEQLKLMFCEFAASAGNLADCWGAACAAAAAAGSPAVVEASEDLSRMTIDVIGRTAFGRDFRALDPARSDPLVRALLGFNELLRGRDRAIWRRAQRMMYVREAIDSRLLELLAAYRFRQFRGVLRSTKEQTRALIGERRAAWLAGRDVPRDLLQLMIEARDEETGRGLSEDEIIDEAVTFLFAGQETSATLLAWTLLCLCRRPDVQDKLREEVDAVLGSGAARRPPVFADFDRLKYTRMVLNEALRLYPPVTSTSRVCLKEDVVAGYRIPVGTMVVIAPYQIHHDERHWPNPLEFDPSRFEGSAEGPRHPFAFMPFGAGPRKCIGQNFALLESAAAVATLAGRFRFEAGWDPGAPPEAVVGVVHRLIALPLRLTPRP